MFSVETTRTDWLTLNDLCVDTVGLSAQRVTVGDAVIANAVASVGDATSAQR